MAFGGGTIEQSYAEGGVTIANTAAVNTAIGGLVGYRGKYGKRQILQSYSTGAVSAPSSTFPGGLIGSAETSNSADSTDWDTTTSGITNLGQGAGNIANYPGITGLTTQQFQSGLPAGFNPKVWAEKSNVNNGLPYLIANPPPS